MPHPGTAGSAGIDGARRERGPRIARGLPGRLGARRQGGRPWTLRERALPALLESNWRSAPLVSIDGVSAAELVARCERG